jgi:phage terminase large subunit-like protein
MVDLDPRRRVDESLPRRSLPSEPVTRAVRVVQSLVVPKGHGARKRLRLLAWEREIVATVFGPRPPRQALVVVGRGNGKTTLAAAMAVHAATWAGVAGAEVVLVATTEEQARRILYVIRRFVEADRWLADRARVYSDRITFPAYGSRILALPAESNALLGLDFSLAICDEIGAMRAETWEAITTASGKRPTSTVLGIGSPVPGSSELLRRLIEYGESQADPSFWLRWYRAPTGCAIDDPDAWRAANPSYPKLMDAATLANLAATTPEASFRAYRLGQFVEDDGAWLRSGVWAACADPTREVECGTEIVIGFDGSYSGDSTALIGCTLDGHVFVLGAWENPNDPSWRVPRVEVDAAVADAFERYQVRRMACDPWGWRAEIEAWEAQFGDEVVVEFPTNSLARIAPAADRFYQAVQLGTLTHDGDARLARHLNNAHVKSTTYGDVIVKDRRGSSHKIDLAVAAVVAFDQAHALPPQRRARVVAF